MTIFGVLLVAVLVLLVASGFAANSRYERTGQEPPTGFYQVLVGLIVIIIGILTFGTGSLL